MQLGGLPGGRLCCSPPDLLRLVRARAHRRALSREPTTIPFSPPYQVCACHLRDMTGAFCMSHVSACRV